MKSAKIIRKGKILCFYAKIIWSVTFGAIIYKFKGDFEIYKHGNGSLKRVWQANHVGGKKAIRHTKANSRNLWSYKISV